MIDTIHAKPGKKTLDITPACSDLVALLITFVTCKLKGPEGDSTREIGQQEFVKMARAADAYVDSRKRLVKALEALRSARQELASVPNPGTIPELCLAQDLLAEVESCLE